PERHPLDARLYQVQGKTELVSDLLSLLQEFYRDKLAELLRHQAGARYVQQYDFNNTYQYIINREDVQLSWIGKAIEELGGTLDDQAAEPALHAPGKGDAAARSVIEVDAREA